MRVKSTIAQNNPETKEKARITNSKPEVHLVRSNSSKATWERMYDQIVSSMTIAQNRPEFREFHNAIMKIINKDPTKRSKAGATIKAHWQTKEFRDKVYAAVMHPECRVRRVSSITAAMRRPETKAKRKATDATPETSTRRSIVNKDSTWMTDGITNRRIKPGEPLPEDWRCGFAYGSEPDTRRKLQDSGRHTRWHVRRNIVNPDCALCRQSPPD